MAFMASIKSDEGPQNMNQMLEADINLNFNPPQENLVNVYEEIEILAKD